MCIYYYLKFILYKPGHYCAHANVRVYKYVSPCLSLSYCLTKMLLQLTIAKIMTFVILIKINVDLLDLLSSYRNQIVLTNSVMHVLYE